MPIDLMGMRRFHALHGLGAVDSLTTPLNAMLSEHVPTKTARAADVRFFEKGRLRHNALAVSFWCEQVGQCRLP